MRALEYDDTESATELVEYWEARFPLGKESRSIFLYSKLRTILRRYELTENTDARIELLSQAVATGNDLFAANETEGFTMNSEVETMWLTLVDYSAEFISAYSEGPYEDDDEDCDDCNASDDSFDEDEEPLPDILTPVLYERIGTINHPNFYP